MRKILAVVMAAVVGLTLSFGGISEAKSGGGARTSGYNRPASMPKASTSAPKGNTSGYKKSSSSSSASNKENTNGYKSSKSSTAPKGSSYTTNGGGKVTSGGGNTSGYKSKQTQTKEKAQENMAKKDTDSDSSSWYGGTNNHFYGDGYNGSGFGHFATGMLFGSLLSSPWHVYAGASGMTSAGGFYSPFSGLIGVIVWLIEWAAILGLLVGLYLFAKRWWRNRRRLKYAEPK